MVSAAVTIVSLLFCVGVTRLTEIITCYTVSYEAGIQWVMKQSYSELWSRHTVSYEAGIQWVMKMMAAAVYWKEEWNNGGMDGWRGLAEERKTALRRSSWRWWMNTLHYQREHSSFVQRICSKDIYLFFVKWRYIDKWLMVVRSVAS